MIESHVRLMSKNDLTTVVSIQKAAYPEWPDEEYLTEDHYLQQMSAFPEGQFVALANGELAGFSTCLILRDDPAIPLNDYMLVTGSGTFDFHDPSGTILYGAEMAIHPRWQGYGLAGKIYVKRRELLRKFNLPVMIAGGRIPGYRDYADQMTAEEYIEKVKAGELNDQALRAHLKAGYMVKGVYQEYMGEVNDAPSLNYATILEYRNPDYKKS